MTGEAPAPSPVGAAMLTLLAWAVAVFGFLLLLPDAGFALSLAIGLCLGYGGVGTLAARTIPAPAEERLGLRGFAPRFLLPILLALPAIVLSSEIDNCVRPLFPSLPLPEAAAGVPNDPEVVRLDAVGLVILDVLLRPVLEEFFFRGVVQQGLVAHVGSVAGVVQTALLSGLASAGIALPYTLPLGPGRAASSAAQGFFLGLLFGLLRQVSGSLLAPMVESVLLSATAVAMSAALSSQVPIAGFNAPGDHTPPAILGACAVAVLLAVVLALRWREAPGVPGGDAGA